MRARRAPPILVSICCRLRSRFAALSSSMAVSTRREAVVRARSIASPSAGVRAREPTSCSTMFLVRFSPTDSPLALPALRPSPSAPPSMPDPMVRDSNALGLGLGLP